MGVVVLDPGPRKRARDWTDKKPAKTLATHSHETAKIRLREDCKWLEFIGASCLSFLVLARLRQRPEVLPRSWPVAARPLTRRAQPCTGCAGTISFRTRTRYCGSRLRRRLPRISASRLISK